MKRRKSFFENKYIENYLIRIERQDIFVNYTHKGIMERTVRIDNPCILTIIISPN
ncbi:MAG: hypothetical protein KatS3mg002_1025 [Candidatus Woesearchaeota archaeon]|jgi:hypothetical protein|nr:MAG: hypothetical protein KatS3mg002_1025 [Candidatus Woesearchaeota archaeon]